MHPFGAVLVATAPATSDRRCDGLQQLHARSTENNFWVPKGIDVPARFSHYSAGYKLGLAHNQVGQDHSFSAATAGLTKLWPTKSRGSGTAYSQGSSTSTQPTS
jgi:hypothetical protein